MSGFCILFFPAFFASRFPLFQIALRVFGGHGLLTAVV